LHRKVWVRTIWVVGQKWRVKKDRRVVPEGGEIVRQRWSMKAHKQGKRPVSVTMTFSWYHGGKRVVARDRSSKRLVDIPPKGP